jgi:hypothetical protein
MMVRVQVCSTLFTVFHHTPRSHIILVTEERVIEAILLALALVEITLALETWEAWADSAALVPGLQLLVQ